MESSERTDGILRQRVDDVPEFDSPQQTGADRIDDHGTPTRAPDEIGGWW